MCEYLIRTLLPDVRDANVHLRGPFARPFVASSQVVDVYACASECWNHALLFHVLKTRAA